MVVVYEDWSELRVIPRPLYVRRKQTLLVYVCVCFCHYESILAMVISNRWTAITSRADLAAPYLLM